MPHLMKVIRMRRIFQSQTIRLRLLERVSVMMRVQMRQGRRRKQREMMMRDPHYNDSVLETEEEEKVVVGKDAVVKECKYEEC